MKKVFITLIAILATAYYGNAQTINWAALQKTNRHIINLNAGLDYGTSFSIGYAYRLKTKLPVLLNISYSFPAGKNISDDFKTQTGIEARLVKAGNIQVSAKVEGIFRRYQNPLASLLNFGGDFGLTAGYYKQHWFAGGELGFDKAIITHFKNSDLARQNFPGIKDGWYEPATGGNFYYGIQAGYSFSRYDVYVKAGNMIEQDFKTKPLLPFYAQVGWNVKL